MKKQDMKETIYACTGREPEPIYKVARKADVSVQTASKYCFVLQAEGRVQIEKFGNMKLVRRTGR